MNYSGSKAVADFSGNALKRELHNGQAVVTPGPQMRVSDRTTVFRIIAFSRCPFVSALHAFTPLAGRLSAATLLPKFFAAPNSPLGLVRVLRGTTTFSLGGFQR